ncbi:MAG: CsbD family protein [Parachlamydiaceae bacterium]|nr:CsbD family protein [Parachlamydiaceae bacterium]
MNKEQFEGEWQQLKGKIKEKWGKLTDDEITEINGKYDQFLGKLQKKYGYAKEKAEDEVKNWKSEKSKAKMH